VYGLGDDLVALWCDLKLDILAGVHSII